jgi:hypothetical protein
MNKLMHGIVLAVFAFACWGVSVILKLPVMAASGMQTQLPAFTRFCMGLGPTVKLTVTGLGVIYCVFVWLRRADKTPSWVAFLAASMSTVVLLMLPMIIAIYLPIVDFINRLPRQQ